MKKFTLLLIQITIFTCLILLATDNVYATENVSDWLENNDDRNSSIQEEQTDTISDASNEEFAVDTKKDSLLLDLVKMVFMLAIVLALIYFLLKFLQKRNKMFQQARSLESLGGISLGSNKSIQIVKIGSKVYIVGVGENVNLLTEIEDQDFINELMEKDKAEAPVNQTLSALINQFKGKKDKQNSNATSFKQMFKKELTSMKKERDNLIENYQGRKEDQDE